MSRSRCDICGTAGPVAVGAPRTRGMLSDGSLLGVPVARLSCRRCGAATLAPHAVRRLPQQLFGRRYGLNATPPSEADLARQAGYAARIAALGGPIAPSSVLDVGCGNGALLLALRAIWPQAQYRGMEPASAAAAMARRSGIEVRQTLAPGVRAALVVAVNVVEHTADPRAFLSRLRVACSPGGRVVVICPDGSTPWLELMMVDHRHSFTPMSLSLVAQAAGLAVVSIDAGSPGGFQAVALQPRRCAQIDQPRMGAGTALARRRRTYLASWRGLDSHLMSKAAPDRRLICFGTGEAAQLIRAYAPACWSRVAAIMADGVSGVEMLGKPLINLAEVSVERDQVLLAVRPQTQAKLADRLTGIGHHVLRWDGIIQA